MPRRPASTTMAASRPRLSTVLRTSEPHTPTYRSVALPKTALNQAKNLPSGPRASFFGLRRRDARAGERDSALKAEMMTDTAMVTANCW
ncbi:MAG: hypothetical protein BWX71_00750 [Deltaproteobacteria bacterium ADurb.Bin072]|nr:MAG: hypothetical protein BWX71_00750 [Deltaproteobacteria bacterium ADurb.Bin072]